MSTDSNRMTNSSNSTTLNNHFVSQSHEQFIPKRMKKTNLFVKTLGLFALILASTFGSFGQNLQYTMSWNSLSGTYGGVSFTAQPLTIKINNVNPNNVSSISWGHYIAFMNGANVTISLGNILTDAPLDNLSSNSLAIAASSTNGNIFIGSSNGTTYGGDRGFVGGFSSSPGTTLEKLTTVWNSTATTAYTSGGFPSAPFTINGLSLYIPSSQNASGGSWGVTSYVVPVPTITLSSPTSLSGFTACFGSTSTSQTTSVSGTQLTADMVLTAPTGYEISTDNVTYSNTLTLTQSGGTVAATTIYVRLSASAAVGTPSGNLTIASTGATTENVALSGTVNALPTVTITDPAAVCTPSTVDITAASVTSGSTAGLTYTYWTDNAATTALASPSAVNATGTYYVLGTTAAGCTDIQPVSVTFNDPITAVAIAVDDQPCGSTASGSATVTLTGGTGLGLSIVKHVSKNHGGEVKVWSALGVGSTFAIRLPIAKEKVE